jgi:hypothetical protein
MQDNQDKERITDEIQRTREYKKILPEGGGAWMFVICIVGEYVCDVRK